MKPSDRIANESPAYQGENEKIAYSLDTSPWNGSPENVTVTIKNTAGSDVSATYLEDTDPIVSGDNITSPRVVSLVAGRKYRLIFNWENNGNELEAYVEIIGQK